MRRLTAAAFLLSSALAAHAQDADTDLVIGGSLGELRAILELKPEQQERVRKLYESVQDKLTDLRKLARSKGADTAREDFRKLQGDTIEEMKKILAGKQLESYAGLLQRKRELAGEFEKALFGIPPVTEMKLKLGLTAEDCVAMQKEADDAVRKIRDKIAELRGKKQTPEQITQAVNELRKDGITKMIESCSKAGQKKVKEHVKWYLADIESKLAKGDVEKLNRAVAALAVKDEDVRKDVRRRVAAVLMHRAEVSWGTKALMRELMLLLAGAKTEDDIWERLAEYGALNDVHRRRLKDLHSDLKQLLGGKEVGKLVSEGILEE